MQTRSLHAGMETQTYLHRDPLDIPIVMYREIGSSKTMCRNTAQPPRQQTAAVLQYPSTPCMLDDADIAVSLRGNLVSSSARSLFSINASHHMPIVQAIKKLIR